MYFQFDYSINLFYKLIEHEESPVSPINAHLFNGKPNVLVINRINSKFLKRPSHKMKKFIRHDDMLAYGFPSQTEKRY